MAAAPIFIPFVAIFAMLLSMQGWAQDAGRPQLADPEFTHPLEQEPSVSAPARASAARPGRTQLAIRNARERLSNGTPDWRDSGLEVLHEFEKRKVLLGSVVESSRFGLRDRTATLEGYYPLSERTTGYFMAAASDTHRVLAKDTIQAQLAHAFGKGWGVMAGLRRADYNTTSVDIADLTLERYFSNFRAAFTVLPAHSSSAGNATSYRLQFGYYYGDEQRVQFMYANGTEVDRPSGADLVIATRVRSSVIYGRHWITNAWALDYGLGRAAQGTVNRNAASVGLRYRF